MRNRLKSRSAEWKKIQCSPTVLYWVETGFPLLWKDSPPPAHFAHNHPSAHEHADFVTTTIKEMLANKTIAQSPTQPRVVSPLGVVPKPGSGKLRLIWDGRYVNEYVVTPDLTYESLSFLPEVLAPNDYMFSLDLKSGYHHLDIHPDYWEFLGFQWQGQYYVFTQLPFGLAPACWAFSKLTREVLTFFRRQGITCTGYIDDSAYASASQEQLMCHQRTVLLTWENLGFLLNWEKSQLTATRTLKYLGMWVDTAAGTFFVPEEKRLRFIHMCQLIANNPTQPVPVKTIASVKGQLLSMSWAFGSVAVRIFSRPLDMDITAAPTWNSVIRISDASLDALNFWITTFDKFNGLARIWGPSQFHTIIHTDAAGADLNTLGGWGAWLCNPKDKGTQQKIAKGRWLTEQSAQSSTWQELTAILLALKAFHGHEKRLKEQNVLVYTDSLNASLSINKGSSRAPHCLEVRKEIFWFCLQEDIRLEAAWIPREENEEADALSKDVDSGDIMLDPAAFSMLQSRWGDFQADLFADAHNAQLNIFYSRYYTPGSFGVNAFTANWSELGFCWANPPFAMLPKTMRHAALCQAKLALLAPIQIWTPWWHSITQLGGCEFTRAVHDYCILPNRKGLFMEGSTRTALPKRGFRVIVLLLNFCEPALKTLPVPMCCRPR